MEIIHCEFNRITKVTVDKLLNAYGVYVIWSGKSLARPSYIGEGDIWSRLCEHRKRFPKPIDGYISVLSNKSTAKTKRDIQIIEAVLLSIGKATDRYAAHNARGGNLSKLFDLFEYNGVVRIHFSGHDPFIQPGASSIMRNKRIVSISHNEDGDLYADHPWRTRRLRKARR